MVEGPGLERECIKPQEAPAEWGEIKLEGSKECRFLHRGGMGLVLRAGKSICSLSKGKRGRF